MPLRLIAAAVAVAVLASAALAETSPTPPTPQSTDDGGHSSAAAVKACQAKWKVEKAKPGTKLGAKAFYTFMANCL
ncbi:MAG: hypothetical protein P4L98_00880 [Ancalomicrobiaceae bacterium]|nr:hypothetical protein [Ancalomicrobiaceae bacterium]